ncbi:MAG TPA: ABC transporter permease [Vicinamibacterales bacterium]
MNSILRDIRYGFRSLAKSPGVTAVAIIALTFGIGMTAAMFSIVYGVMLKGLPYPDGDRIVTVYRNNTLNGSQRDAVTAADYMDYKARQHSLSILAAYSTGTINVSGVGQAERYSGGWVSASIFDIAKTPVVLGRTFTAEDDVPNGPKVTLISYGMWKTRFGGEPNVLGQVIRANGQPYTIVGVLPEKYAFPDNSSIWLPLQLAPVSAKRDDGPSLNVVGMLKPATTIDQAALDFATIAKQLQTEFKETNANYTADVKGFVDANVGPEPHQLLYSMLGAVFLVLLIACANVANLLLDRAAHKTKEVGIRTALGASRAAVVRQFLTEALVLSAGGAIGGTALALGVITMFNRSLVDTDVPFFIDIRMHPAVLAFVIALAIVSTLFSGAIPALQASRSDINEVLKDENRGSSSLKMGRMSRALVVFEIALSCGLLVASGLMIKSVTKLRTMDPGFSTHDVFTARVGFPATYTDTTAQKQFMVQLRQNLAAIPGVRGAAIASNLPGAGGSNGGPAMIEGVSYAADRDVPNPRWYAVTDGYFGAYSVKLLEGRSFNVSDRADAAPVAVVNKAFADKFFPSTDPVGRRIRQGGLTSKEPWMTIVGVVPTMFSGDAAHPRVPAYFAPLSQHHSSFVSLIVQTSGPPMAVTQQVRQAVAQLNPDIPLYWVYSMDEAIARPLWYIRVFGTMFMVFGAIALFLAAIGLYAVMSFSVSRRTREVGIRMALGAQAGQVIRMMFRQGLIQLSAGIALGLLLAGVVGQATSVILFDVQPRDPQVFGGVVVVLTIAGMLACLLPARRATRVDPLTALRSQ